MIELGSFSPEGYRVMLMVSLQSKPKLGLIAGWDQPIIFGWSWHADVCLLWLRVGLCVYYCDKLD